MTINIMITNPDEHKPSELRALALLLNTWAHDAEQAVGISPKPAAPVAHGASSTSTPVPDANASDDENTTDESANTGEADSAGVFYDARIHSETKGRNKDETWRLRRNVDKDLVAEVLAEQKAAADSAKSVDTDTDAPELPEDDAPELPGDTDDAPELPPEDDAPAPVVDDTPPVKAADVVKFVTSNKIDKETARGVYTSFEVKAPADLFKASPETLAAILEMLQSLV